MSSRVNSRTFTRDLQENQAFNRNPRVDRGSKSSAVIASATAAAAPHRVSPGKSWAQVASTPVVAAKLPAATSSPSEWRPVNAASSRNSQRPRLASDRWTAEAAQSNRQQSGRWSRSFESAQVVQSDRRVPEVSVSKSSSVPVCKAHSHTFRVLSSSQVADEVCAYLKELKGDIDLEMSRSLAEGLKFHGERRSGLLAGAEVVVGDFVIVNGRMVFAKDEYLARCCAPIAPIDRKEQLKYLLEGFRFTPIGRWADAFGNFPFKVAADYAPAWTALMANTEHVAKANTAVCEALTRTPKSSLNSF